MTQCLHTLTECWRRTPWQVVLLTYTLAGGIAVVCLTVSHPQPAVANGCR